MSLGKPFETFLTTLRRITKPCEFGDQEKKYVCAQIGLGKKSIEIQQELLQDNMSIDSILNKKARQSEETLDS